MLLAIDIGNSTIGLGMFLNPEKSKKLFIKKIPTHPAQSAERYKKIIAEIIEHFTHSPKIDAIISSVVPSLNQPITSAIKSICCKEPLIVSHKLESGLISNAAHPEKIGADRIANAVAGFHYFKRPVAIIDFGTATTVTVVSPKKSHDFLGMPVFLGGTIMPGIQLMQKALYSGTAKLPLISLKKPKKVLGEDTTSSIASGIINGTAGAVESLIRNMEKELGFRLKLVLTGGHAKLMSHLIQRDYILIPNLTFEGLRLIYLKVTSGK
jgi:type III pantothenate kinase